MLVRIRTVLAYVLIALGLALTMPWCAALGWLTFEGLARLTAFVWVLV
jgi:hypothetical protein